MASWMSRPTVDFLMYLFGRRDPRTSVTLAERSLLCSLASSKSCVVEVGVFEGVTSLALAEAIADGGWLYLIDPYLRHTWPERLFKTSYSEVIAKQVLRRWSDRVHFVPKTSVDAARAVDWACPADLVFIDGDHSYNSVRDDFLAWRRILAPDGTIAFHDSRPCAERQDLQAITGPVRLVDEILRGEHGRWNLIGEAESVAAFRRA
jgi:predicted O-methyltransferase YrrM